MSDTGPDADRSDSDRSATHRGDRGTDTDGKNTGEKSERPDDRKSEKPERPDDRTISTREYVTLVLLNRVSLAGIGIAIVGAILVTLSSPRSLLTGWDPMIGAAMLLVGMFVLALGYSLGQKQLGEEESW